MTVCLYLHPRSILSRVNRFCFCIPVELRYESVYTHISSVNIYLRGIISYENSPLLLRTCGRRSLSLSLSVSLSLVSLSHTHTQSVSSLSSFFSRLSNSLFLCTLCQQTPEEHPITETQTEVFLSSLSLFLSLFLCAPYVKMPMGNITLLGNLHSGLCVCAFVCICICVCIYINLLLSNTYTEEVNLIDTYT